MLLLSVLKVLLLLLMLLVVLLHVNDCCFITARMVVRRTGGN
jgi:hypothetical protein